jgi:hypothetical protein
MAEAQDYFTYRVNSPAVKSPLIDHNELISSCNMLIMSDRLRKLLQDSATMDDDFIKTLDSLMQNLSIHVDSIKFEEIMFARLNKLLDAVIEVVPDGAKSNVFNELKVMAITIRNKWNRKFVAELFEIDDLRNQWLFGSTGPLANVEPVPSPMNTSPQWTAVERVPGAGSSSIRFEAGR